MKDQCIQDLLKKIEELDSKITGKENSKINFSMSSD
jgi:hypothetical protein